MKTFFHIFIVISIFVSVHSTYGQDLKNYKLKGNVKSYHEIDYEVVDKFGEIKKGNKISDNSGVDELKSFDIKGKETESINHIIYNSENGVTIIQVKIILKRDSNGNLIEKSTYQSDDNSLFTEKFKYNENGQVLEETTSDGITTSSIGYKYDENGNCNVYYQDGSIFSKEIFVEGHKTERIKFYPRGNIEDSYKYDINGNVIEHSNFNSDGTLFYHKTWRYDLNGNEIENISKTFQSKTTYDLNQNKIEKIISYNDGTKEITTYKYTVDTHGNWIIRIQSSDGKPLYWTERTIVYYQ